MGGRSAHLESIPSPITQPPQQVNLLNDCWLVPLVLPHVVMRLMRTRMVLRTANVLCCKLTSLSELPLAVSAETSALAVV